MKKSIPFILLVIISCSNVNEEAKQEYYKNAKFQHGIKVVDVRPTNVPDFNMQQAKLGKKVYMSYCYDCHGKEGRGNGPFADVLDKKPRDLQKIIGRVEHFDFYMKVSQWRSNMPGWNNPITKEQISQINHYLKSLKK